MKKNCLTCNKVIDVLQYQLNKGWGKYCSIKCSSKGRHNPNSRWLDKDFVKKYNSYYRRNVLKKKPFRNKEYIPQICLECNKKFLISRFSNEQRKRKFCSRNCSFNWHKKSFEGAKSTCNGYIVIKVSTHPLANNRGYVYEHRLNMEKKLGRYLTRNEVVHHINGVKTDNRTENLEIFNSTGEHTTFHLLRGDIKKWK